MLVESTPKFSVKIKVTVRIELLKIINRADRKKTISIPQIAVG